MVPEFNPLEKLPILVSSTGEAIYESRLIVEWLEKHFPEPPMIPAETEAYLETKLCEVLADGTLDALLLYQFEKRREVPSPDWSQRQLRKLRGGLGEISRKLKGREFAVGDRFSLADAAFISVVGALDFCDDQITLEEFDWRGQFPALRAWAMSFSDRPSVRETVPLPFEEALQ